MRHPLFYWLIVANAIAVNAQVKTETRNIILVTLDGFRWQEVFRGGSPSILENNKYVLASDSVEQFRGISTAERRNKLLPFFWSTIATQGQLYGNRDVYNYVDCANQYWFSYPGYHELLVGAVNKKVCTNLKIENPDATILEFLDGQAGFRNSVAAFTTWDVFPYILRATRSGIPLNKSVENAIKGGVFSGTDVPLKQRQLETEQGDSVTFQLAFDYLKKVKPRLLYLAFDGTDHYAHKARYDQYLLAAHQIDAWLHLIWNWVQTDPEFKDHTTLIITTDHGRGKNPKKAWRHHGRFTFGSGQIWLAAIGPDTPPRGEMRGPQHFYQKQIASTIAALVGFNYANKFPVGPAIESMIESPALVAGQNRRWASKLPNDR